MDCPYFEQLMYVGDTRLEALVTYAVSGDDRLARKAIRLFDGSRGADGLTQSRYPSRVRQVIPPFSLAWVGMVHDFAMWRGDAAVVRSVMPGVRAVIEAFLTFRNADRLIEGPATGWNYVDWVPGWKNGVPPDGDAGVSSVINWQFVGALRQAKELEEWLGEPELAARCDRLAREVAGAIDGVFWEPVRALYADDRARRRFSEHAQCLALLSGYLPAERLPAVGHALLTNRELARTTIYFSHYLFEALRELAHSSQRWSVDPIATLFDRLSLWFDLRRQGFVTPFEEPEPSRSDCHGWGSHPLFHYFATMLGVRPGAIGFERVDVRPNLSALTWAKGRLPHPSGGWIEVDLRDGAGSIHLPPGVTGRVVSRNESRELRPGKNDL
jgi:hypothetical protein